MRIGTAELERLRPLVTEFWRAYRTVREPDAELAARATGFAGDICSTACSQQRPSDRGSAGSTWPRPASAGLRCCGRMISPASWDFWMPDPLDAVLAAVDCDVAAGTASVNSRTVQADSERALRRALISALYDELHAGRAEPAFRHRRLRDPHLDARYAAALPHARIGLQTPVHEVDEENGRVLIERDGVRTWNPWDGGTLTAGTPAQILVAAARPALSPGFFLADSSHGPPESGPILRCYLHITAADPAVSLWERPLSFLEEQRLRFRAKVSSVPNLFPRRDALVLYLDSDGAPAVAGLAAVLAGMPGIGAGTSMFARPLAAGIATAWEPEDPRPGMLGLSFGEHRAAAVAAGLIEASRTGTDRRATVVNALTAACIDPARLWRNLNSPES